PLPLRPKLKLPTRRRDDEAAGAFGAALTDVIFGVGDDGVLLRCLAKIRRGLEAAFEVGRADRFQLHFGLGSPWRGHDREDAADGAVVAGVGFYRHLAAGGAKDARAQRGPRYVGRFVELRRRRDFHFSGVTEFDRAVDVFGFDHRQIVSRRFLVVRGQLDFAAVEDGVGVDHFHGEQLKRPGDTAFGACHFPPDVVDSAIVFHLSTQHYGPAFETEARRGYLRRPDQRTAVFATTIFDAGSRDRWQRQRQGHES